MRTNHALKKFEQWFARVEAMLNDYSTSIHKFCYASRMLIEWSRKLQERQPEEYTRVLERKNELVLQVGDAIYNHYLQKLTDVKKKRKVGSAPRITSLWQMFYYTEAYVIPCYTECHSLERGYDAIKLILNDIAPEFPSYKEIHENPNWKFAANRLHKFLITLQETGFDVPQSLVDKFREPDRSIFQPYN